jgi:hypothetical protein
MEVGVMCLAPLWEWEDVHCQKGSLNTNDQLKNIWSSNNKHGYRTNLTAWRPDSVQVERPRDISESGKTLLRYETQTRDHGNVSLSVVRHPIGYRH